MTKVIICGHGGYARGMKDNITMLLGEVEGFHYLDFAPSQDAEEFKTELVKLLGTFGKDSQVLFACDIAGGSPFKVSALISAENPNYCTVAGLNTSAYAEMAYNLKMPPRELADMAAGIAKETIEIFPS